jgi:hypothetical protein
MKVDSALTVPPSALTVQKQDIVVSIAIGVPLESRGATTFMDSRYKSVNAFSPRDIFKTSIAKLSWTSCIAGKVLGIVSCAKKGAAWRVA